MMMDDLFQAKRSMLGGSEPRRTTMTGEPRTRQELVDQIAGLLSTVGFRPSENHPMAMDIYADQIVSLCDARLKAIADTYMEAGTGEWNYDDDLGKRKRLRDDWPELSSELLALTKGNE
jgi:hypothetical protein